MEIEVFKMFLSYLYYGEMAFSAVGNGINFAVQDALFLFECADFYAMGTNNLKEIAE